MKFQYSIVLAALFVSSCLIVSSDSMFQNMINSASSSSSSGTASSSGDDSLFQQLGQGASSSTQTSTSSSTSDGSQSLQNFLNQGQQIQNQVEKEEKYQELLQERYQKLYLAGGSDIMATLQQAKLIDAYNQVIAQIGSPLASVALEKKVIQGYTKAFQSELAAYQQAQLPIRILPSDMSYSLFISICNIYITHLQYQIHNILNDLQKEKDLDQFAKVITAYKTYENQVEVLAGNFPDQIVAYDEKTGTTKAVKVDLSKQAMVQYHQKIADFLLPAVHRIVVFVSQQDDPSNQVADVESIYNFLNQTKQLQLPVKGYVKFNDFMIDLSSYLAVMYQKSAAIVEKKVDFVEKTTEENYSYLQTALHDYTQAVAMYAKIPGVKAQQNVALYKHKASLIQEKYGAMQTGIEKQKSADDAIVQASKVVQGSKASVDQLKAAVSQIGKALQDYAAAQEQFEVVGDAAAQATVSQAKTTASGLYYVVGLRFLWASFLANSSSGGQFLHDYFSQISIDDVLYRKNSDLFLQSMQDLYQICMKNDPYQLSTKSTSHMYLLLYVQQAVQLYGSANLSASTTTQSQGKKSSGHQKIMNQLQDIETVVKNIAQFAQALTALDQQILADDIDQISNIQTSISTVLQYAQKLDDVYTNTNDVSDYVSSLAQTVLSSGKKTFNQFVLQHIYYICMNSAADLQDRNKNILAMSYYSILQNLSLTKSQLKIVKQRIQDLQAKTNIVMQADKILQQAGQAGQWQQQGSHIVNQTWLNAISLYATAYSTQQGQVSADKEKAVLQKYVDALRGYIDSYHKNVPGAKQLPFDLFGVYNNLYFVLLGQDSADLHTVASDIFALFSTSGKTGFFDQLQNNLAVLQSSSASTDEKNKAHTAVEMSIATFKLLQSQQMQYIRTAVSFFHTGVSGVLSSNTNKDTLTLQLAVKGQKTLQVVVANIQSFILGEYLASGNEAFAQAEAYEKSQDFLQASQSYKKAQQGYKNVIEKASDAELITQAKRQYFLAQTRAQASLLAGMIQRGSVVTVGTIENIALQYVISQYSIQIPLDLIDALPASLASLKNNQETIVNDKIRGDLEMLLKRFIVSQVVASQGFSYSSCYQGQTLQRISGLGQAASNVCNQAEKIAENFIAELNKNVDKGVMVDGKAVKTIFTVKVIHPKTVIVTFKNAQIAPIVPMYPGAVYATEYYGTALLLFKPGKQLIHAGSITYVPGQDEAAAALMREYMAGTSVATARIHIDAAHQLATQIHNDIKKLQSQHKQVDLTVYQDSYNQMKNDYETAVSLLMDPSSGAKTYYEQNNMSKLAQAVEAYVMMMYEQYAQDIENMLAGDPTASMYNTILHDLNLAYNTQKQLATDATIKHQMDLKVAQLFESAAHACLTYKYKTITAPSDASKLLHLYHCYDAVPNFIAAQQKYEALHMSDKAQAMKVAKVGATAQASAQNFLQYMFVKNYGTSYKDLLSGSQVKVTFDRLMTDYAVFQNQYSLSSSTAMPTAELDEYNNLRSLLLDGIMFCSSTSNDYQSLPGGTDDIAQSINTYLKNNNIEMTEETKDASTSNSDASTKGSDTEKQIDIYVPVFKDDTNCGSILNLAAKGLKNFAGQNAQLAAWLMTLHKVGSYLYIYDFLGGVQTTSDAKKEAKEWVSKFQMLQQAIQAEGTRLQNPSSAYVG